MIDRSTLSQNLLSSLSKVFPTKNNSQFTLLKDAQTKRMNDLLINKTIPVIFHDNVLTLRDTNKTC